MQVRASGRASRRPAAMGLTAALADAVRVALQLAERPVEIVQPARGPARRGRRPERVRTRSSPLQDRVRRRCSSRCPRRRACGTLASDALRRSCVWVRSAVRRLRTAPVPCRRLQRPTATRAFRWLRCSRESASRTRRSTNAGSAQRRSPPACADLDTAVNAALSVQLVDHDAAVRADEDVGPSAAPAQSSASKASRRPAAGSRGDGCR